MNLTSEIPEEDRMFSIRLRVPLASIGSHRTLEQYDSGSKGSRPECDPAVKVQDIFLLAVIFNIRSEINFALLRAIEPSLS